MEEKNKTIQVFYGLYNTKEFSTYQEALEWIDSYLKEYGLRYYKVNEVISYVPCSYNQEKKFKIQTLLYQYSTLYIEQFVIMFDVSLSALLSSLRYQKQLKEDGINGED